MSSHSSSSSSPDPLAKRLIPVPNCFPDRSLDYDRYTANPGHLIPAYREPPVLPIDPVNAAQKNFNARTIVRTQKTASDLPYVQLELEGALQQAHQELTKAQSDFLTAKSDLALSQKAKDAEAREREAAIADEEQRLAVIREQESAHAHELNQARAHLDNLEATNFLSTAIIDRTLKRNGKMIRTIVNESDPQKCKRMEVRHNAQGRRNYSMKKALSQQANRHIAWKAECTLAGARTLPSGALPWPVVSTLGPASVLAAFGRMASVPFESGHDDAIRIATAILVAQTPPCVGHRPHRHVGHMVLSLPLSRGIPFTWSLESGVRGARHALMSQGADPDQHDGLVFLHRQRKADGDDHDEEAIHIFWSRVRSDGWILTTPSALASAHLGCSRWNVAAGFDALRLGLCSMKSHPVRAGYKALAAGTLAASYRHPDIISERIPVPLQSDDFLQKLANEGKPSAGECGGVWIPKPGYRTEAEISTVLRHLYTTGK